MRPLSNSTVATCYYFRSARLVSNKVSVEVVSMQEFMMTTRVNNVCDDTAEDAVHDAVETELVALQTGSGDDELVEMSSRRCWSSRSTGQSWSATGRRRGPHVFSRRDTPRHVHIHKHDRGMARRYTLPVFTRPVKAALAHG